MDRLYRFVGEHLPELCAAAASLIVFAVGVRLAWTSDPTWLNRAGALVIIIGVLLAASRFHEWVSQKVIESIEKNPELISQHAVAIYEEEANAPLNEEERESLLSAIRRQFSGGSKSELRKSLAAHLNSRIEPAKRRIRLWEIYLVIGGTFLNGFGDYLVSLLRNNGT